MLNVTVSVQMFSFTTMAFLAVEYISYVSASVRIPGLGTYETGIHGRIWSRNIGALAGGRVNTGVEILNV
jgi:hypothetical protein